jgi:hypothetical protein
MSCTLRATLGLALCVACLKPDTAVAEDIAEGGSPLYSIAVCESIEGLKNLGKPEEPAKGKVCPKCGKVHPPQAASRTNDVRAVSSPSPPSGGRDNAKTNLPTVVSAPQAAVPETETSEYYYCPNCKIYHRRKATPPHAVRPRALSVPGLAR